MNAVALQEKIIAAVKLKIPGHGSLPDLLAELLNISADSAYRRIRNEKLFSLDEVYTICQAYNISLDNMLAGKKEAVLFSGNLINVNDFNLEQHLKNILAQVESIMPFTHKQMFYLAKDLPIFHYFQYPELSAFKFFVWLKNLLNTPAYKSKKFSSADILEKDLWEIGKKIIAAYNQIPSIEIWNIETINSSIRQIEYCQEALLFENSNDAVILYQQLMQLVAHIEQQAENGLKYSINETPSSDNAAFTLYFNEIILGDNSIVFEMDEERVCFVNHAVINYAATTDKVFCDYSIAFLQNLIKKSALISSSGAKDRSKFFNRLYATIEQKIKETK